MGESRQAPTTASRGVSRSSTAVGEMSDCREPIHGRGLPGVRLCRSISRADRPAVPVSLHDRSALKGDEAFSWEGQVRVFCW
jgi:hypothetical protein